VIEVTRLSGDALVINAELIECVEATPDTVITLTTGRKLIVKDTLEQVVDSVVEYRRRIASGTPAPCAGGMCC